MTICDFSSGLSSAGRPDPEQQTATAGRAGRSDLTHQTATTSPPETESKYVSITERMARRRYRTRTDVLKSALCELI